MKQTAKPEQNTTEKKKVKDVQENDLEVCLTDMLVNLYNSKDQSVYEKLYIKVVHILSNFDK